MATKLVFIELIEEIQYLEYLHNDEIIVVTTDPVVELELQKRGIDCRNTIDIFGKDGHEEVSNAVTSVVKVIRPLLKGLSHREVTHAFERTAVFYLRFLLNYIFSQIYLIHRAVNTISFDEVVVLPSVSISQFKVSVKHDIPLLGMLLAAYGSKYQLKLCYPLGGSKHRSLRVKNGLPNWSKSSAFFLMIILYRFVSGKYKTVIVPDESYGMPSFLNTVSQDVKQMLPVYLSSSSKTFKERVNDMLHGRSFSFFSLPEMKGKEVNSQYDDQWMHCLRKIKKTTLIHPSRFQFCGVNVTDLVIEYISNGLTREMRQLNGRIGALYRIFEASTPNAVFSQHAVGVSYALGEICRNHKIPGMLITHGSHVPHTQEIAKKEWSEHARTLLTTHYPYVAVQTPWADRFLRSQTGFISKPIPTGPLLFAQKSQLDEPRELLRQKVYVRNANEKIILHAGSPKHWRSFRPWVYETLDEYVRNINQLIVAVQEVPEVHLAIRYRPMRDLSTERFKSLLLKSNCYKVYDKGSFDEYLLAADMLVSYSSTTIEEALQNRIPVLQYDPDAKYWHIPIHDYFGKSQRHTKVVQCASTHADLLKILIELVNANSDDIKSTDWNDHSMRSDKSSWIHEMFDS